jgi:hypothetical protein
MKWRKLGLVYGPSGDPAWAAHTAMTPTPVVMDAERVRVYAGFRDLDGVSRIGWVDIAADDPTRVLNVCREPALDVGRPGCFDDNGVILGDVVRVGDRLRMYYVGFQLVQKAKFLAFTGAAESTDGGNSYTRLGETPILDRADEGLFIRAIHTALPVDGGWRVWYAAGSDWATIAGTPYPSYHVRTLESPDGLTFAKVGSVCLTGVGHEYRLGRPRVWQEGNGYQMLFTYGTLDGAYRPGAARSADGRSWTRDDSEAGLAPTPETFDSETVCYPVPFRAGGRWYIVYNGNGFGRDGFGCAVLAEP